MFDLEREIAEWRGRMAAGGVGNPAVLDELESHLRDVVEAQLRSGCEVAGAFAAGVERIGSAGALNREFARADRMLSFARLTALVGDRRKCRWLAVAAAALAAAGFYGWHARITPVYAGVATVELHFPRQSSAENSIRAAEGLNTSVLLLTSKRVKTNVAGSFTAAELQVISRTPAKRGLLGKPTPTVEQRLETLLVRIRRLSFVVTLSVTHEDAEAAALIANRYVEQWRAELASSANFTGVSVRDIDRATPSPGPVAPNLKRILSTAIGVGVMVFTAVLLTAALLRKLARMRMDDAPVVRTS